MLKITRKQGQETYFTWGQGDDEIILGSFKCYIEGDRISINFDMNNQINILREEVLARRDNKLLDSRGIDGNTR